MVEDEVRVQVAVASVSERRDANAVAVGRGLDGDEEVGHATDRHPDVLHSDDALALERAKREPSGLAEPVGFGGVRRPDDAGRAGRLACGNRAIELDDRAGFRQVALDQQHRRRVAVETELERVVDREDRLVIEQLQGHWTDPRLDDRGHGVPGRGERREERQQRRPRRRRNPEPQRRFRDDSERPL